MKSSNRFRQAAFTLTEAVVAIGMFGITASSGVSALLRMNNNAALSRLQTGASTVVQNQMDLALSDSPFNPQKGQIPPVLVSGTTSAGTSTNPTVPVYTDPKTGLNVQGWMTTTVADTGVALSGQSLNIYRINVTVFYRFKGRQYTVSMSSLRSSDI